MKENRQKRREAAPGQPRDCQGEPAVRREQEERHRRRAARGAEAENWDEDHREQGDTQKTKSLREGPKDQAEPPHAEKRRLKSKEKAEPHQEPQVQPHKKAKPR